jgi:DNA-binding NarL/FixJ family response regulator
MLSTSDDESTENILHAPIRFEPTAPELESDHAARAADLVRRRAIPALYVVDEALRVHFSCGVLQDARADRLPARVERIFRNLTAEASKGANDSSIGVDGDMVVRVVPTYSQTANLTSIIVEKLRKRDPLHEAIQRFSFTAREAQVLRLLLLGASTAAIARKLHIAETTACEHVSRIARKTASRGRGQIVARVLGFR